MKTLSANAIGPEHPSFGCTKAAFLFAKTIPGPFGGIEKLVLVEAPNEWAVQTIERILLIFHNQVNEGYRAVGIFMDCSLIGIRSRDMEEIDYVDFMINVVNHGCLINDPVTATAFEKSLNDKTRNRAKKLLDAEAKKLTTKDIRKSAKPAPVRPIEFEPRQEFKVMDFPKPKPFFDPATSQNYQKALAALTDLGFKKPHAKKILEDMGTEVDNMSIEDLVKVCLQKIAS
jgi:hypothetical protein